MNKSAWSDFGFIFPGLYEYGNCESARVQNGVACLYSLVFTAYS